MHRNVARKVAALAARNRLVADQLRTLFDLSQLHLSAMVRLARLVEADPELTGDMEVGEDIGDGAITLRQMHERTAWALGVLARLQDATREQARRQESAA